MQQLLRWAEHIWILDTPDWIIYEKVRSTLFLIPFSLKNLDTGWHAFTETSTALNEWPHKAPWSLLRRKIRCPFGPITSIKNKFINNCELFEKLIFALPQVFLLTPGHCGLCCIFEEVYDTEEPCLSVSSTWKASKFGCVATNLVSCSLRSLIWIVSCLLRMLSEKQRNYFGSLKFCLALRFAMGTCKHLINA